jgi:hypothetical protein
MESEQATGHEVNDVQTDAVPSTTPDPERHIPRQENHAHPASGRQLNSPSSGGLMPSFIYAIGRIEVRFPSIGVEKEVAQATGHAETAGLTDRQALYEMLKEHRYLVRQLCWVFTVAGLETYILQPRDPADFGLLVEAFRRSSSPMDMDVVVGVRGPIAPPELCNGLMVPIVAFDQLYSFTRDDLLKSIPRAEDADDDQLEAAAGELLDRIMLMADNAGATDEHRAVNYLVMRYPAIYGRTLESHRGNASLTAVEVRPSPLSGTRRIMNVIFSYTNRSTDVVEKFSARVDVTEEFPFLVAKLSPYFDITA